MTQKIPLVVADFETQLSTEISVGITSFSIASNTDDDGNSIPTGKYCMTVDGGSTNKEYFTFDLSGTSATNVVSTDRQGNETSGAVRAHRVGAPCVITDFATIQRVADILRGASTLDGDSPLIYDTDPTLSDGKQVATVQYVLDTVTGGTVEFSSQIITGTAGESLASPNVVYFKEVGARWWKSDADDSATYDGLKIGIAQSTATAGNGVTVQLSGLASGFSGLSAGSKYYLSTTAGGVSTTASNLFIGWAVNTTTLLLAQKEIYFPKKGEKDALVGTYGTPSSSNKYVTSTDIGVGVQSLSVPTVTTFTSNGTWTKPANLFYAIVEVQAGGGGGGGSTSDGDTGGGGGGGGYSRKLISTGTLGATETVTVGAGGGGGSGVTGGAGSAGGDSSFGSHCSATGGGGGNSTNSAGGGGGIGSNGNVNVGGGGGGGSSRSGSISNVSPNGGSSFLGGGGQSAGFESSASGLSYGGGGGGSSSGGPNVNGGSGAQGIVIVTEYYK